MVKQNNVTVKIPKTSGIKQSFFTSLYFPFRYQGCHTAPRAGNYSRKPGCITILALPDMQTNTSKPVMCNNPAATQ